MEGKTIQENKNAIYKLKKKNVFLFRSVACQFVNVTLTNELTIQIVFSYTDIILYPIICLELHVNFKSLNAVVFVSKRNSLWCSLHVQQILMNILHLREFNATFSINKICIAVGLDI